MILLLDTAGPVCRLLLVTDDKRIDTEWQADRALAKGLLGFLEGELQSHGKAFSDLAGIGVFRGPGSFTGLRIGITVMNTFADTLSIPIVGESGEDWQQLAMTRLHRGENDRVVLPLYGGEANITTPRK